MPTGVSRKARPNLDYGEHRRFRVDLLSSPVLTLPPRRNRSPFALRRFMRSNAVRYPKTLQAPTMTKR